MHKLNINNELQQFLVSILTERYYSTTNLEELNHINALYKMLGVQSEAWLTAFQKYSDKGDK